MFGIEAFFAALPDAIKAVVLAGEGDHFCSGLDLGELTSRGIAQGIGMGLMEEYHAGRTDNLHDYLIPTAGDVPPIVVHLIEDPEPLGPFGAKGVGEPALIATAPAIFNAIYHACGVRPAHAPATPHRLRALLRAKEGR